MRTEETGIGGGSIETDENINLLDPEFFRLKTKLEKVFGPNLIGRKLNASFEFGKESFPLTVFVSSGSIVLQISCGNPVLEISANGRKNFQKVAENLPVVFMQINFSAIIDSVVETVVPEKVKLDENVFDSMRSIIQRYL